MIRELPSATPDGFYWRVNRTPEKMGFATAVWRICTPAYAGRRKGGRPGIGTPMADGARRMSPMSSSKRS